MFLLSEHRTVASAVTFCFQSSHQKKKKEKKKRRDDFGFKVTVSHQKTKSGSFGNASRNQQAVD